MQATNHSWRNLDIAAINSFGRIRSLADAANIVQKDSQIGESRALEITYDLLDVIALLATIGAARAENPAGARHE